MAFNQPSRSDVHVDGPLTNISLAFVQDADNFVADRVFPNISVSFQSDVYYTYDRGNFNRDEMKERAPGTESAGGTYTVATDSYRAVTRAYHRDIADPIRANADAAIDLDREATIYVSSKGLIKREVTWRTSYFTQGDPGDTWSFDVDGVASGATPDATFDPENPALNDKLHWSDESSSPIEDVRQGKRFVQRSTGFRPNIMVCGREVFDILLDHPDIVGRLDRGQTPNGPAVANRESLAALFELEEIVVMDAIQNLADEGATNDHQFIGGKHALLCYRPPAPGLMTPSAGYTFSWTGLTGSTSNGVRIKRFRLDVIESDRIEIDMSYDQKKVSADLGYFFGGIVA